MRRKNWLKATPSYGIPQTSSQNPGLSTQLPVSMVPNLLGLPPGSVGEPEPLASTPRLLLPPAIPISHLDPPGTPGG